MSEELDDMSEKAVRRLESVATRLEKLALGREAWQQAAAATSAREARSERQPPPINQGTVTFPNYGRSKGKPVFGASESDLRFYAAGCQRTLDDPSKARWHEKEEILLAAIEDEMKRQGLLSDGGDDPNDAPSDDVPF